ncbi:MAG: hypothetical protein RR328_03605, partial [Bacteroidales bacterium]
MSENTPISEPKQENEIDLLALTIKCFRAIGHGICVLFKGIGHALFLFLQFIIRRFTLVCVFLVIGVAVAVTYYLISPAAFQGEAIIQCNGFEVQNLDNEVNKLNKMLHGSDDLYVARTLGISIPMVKQIRSIRMGYGIDLDQDGITNEVSYNEMGKKNIIEETILKGQEGTAGTIRKKVLRGRVPGIAYLNLRTSTTNPATYRQISNALFNYIRRNPSLSRAYESNRISIVEQISQLTFQIDRLDSLQSIEYIEMARKRSQGMANSDKIVFTSYQEKDRQLFHGEMLALETQRNGLEAQLRLQTTNITVLSDFQPILG